MNKRKRSILYGMSLGDGCLNLGKGFVTYALTVGHGPKQERYLNYKADLLLSILGGKRVNISYYQSHNKSTNKTYTNLQFRKTHVYFNQMHRNLYKTGTKVFTRKVLDFLDDQGLALWFMDDGSGAVSKNKNGNSCGCMLRIATYFSKEEAEVCKAWFQEKYGVVTKFDVDKRNDRVSLRFGTLDSKKLALVLKPFIPDFMSYKINCVLEYSPRVLGSTIVDEDIV